MKTNWAERGGVNFTERPEHREWLIGQARGLLDFFQPNVINPAGGFFALDNAGQPFLSQNDPAGPVRQLHETTRMVHCFAIAKHMGRTGADDVIDHGMAFLWDRHRDARNGGYYWAVNDRAAADPLKQAYGHAFVILAAASAKSVQHPDADRLLEDATDVLLSRFWLPEFGVTSEEYTENWEAISDYRGQNSNMHLTEALMAAHEVSHGRMYLDMAEQIADRIINQSARQQGWRVAEHFNAAWQVDRDYAGDPMFRPAGTTPGHALEWSRLLIQLWVLGGRQFDWMPDAAEKLFQNAVGAGWDAGKGGFYYTLDWADVPDRSDRYWWPCAEGIGAAASLPAVRGKTDYETWYRRIWGFVDAHIIDREQGGWHPELDSELQPVNRVFVGKPDLYHAFQACLIPLVPPGESIVHGIAELADRKILA